MEFENLISSEYPYESSSRISKHLEKTTKYAWPKGCDLDEQLT